MKSSGIITLTTDFGFMDPYIGVMKGVILSINPEARVIDVGHQLKTGFIFQASTLIQEAYPFFPEGTVHVAVVDPGVGGDRRPIVVRTKAHLFVGPDNGIFWPIITAFPHVEIIHLRENKYFLPHISQTFHGRDIFAPVAAHLSRGIDPSEMGPGISNPVPLEFPSPQQRGDIMAGQVMRVDHFGNLITNVQRKELEKFLGSRRPVITVGKLIVEGMHKRYGEALAGEALALIGSSDYLEIAVNLGRACDVTGMNREGIIGMEIEVSRSQGLARKC
ncbi:MAG: SAM-dependent chlorinase/fluorinase [Desulfobacteraceae bacterium]|nr:MAG: SAM-dependent chlorinase/fluorinase [Desulfobacteraceae bacterium]